MSKVNKYSLRLMPCPLCGGHAEVEFGDLYFSRATWVECQKCGLKTSQKTADLEYCAVEEVIKAWNKRVGDCL